MNEARVEKSTMKEAMIKEDAINEEAIKKDAKNEDAINEASIKAIVKNVKDKRPLIHCITNYVTVNDVANVLLAAGGSPIMADDAKEVEEITSICNGLVINIGTLNERTIESMFLAGKKAKSLGHICVLDPVGAGASHFRTDTAKGLMKEVCFDIIRGNMSEIKALAGAEAMTAGVDANVLDTVTTENLKESVAFVRAFAQKKACVVAVTGAIDIISDGQISHVIKNGTSYMSNVTGTGCQLSALVGALASANKSQLLEATSIAVAMMGFAGEMAWSRQKEGDGNATYRNRIIDAIATMDAQKLTEGMRYEKFEG